MKRAAKFFNLHKRKLYVSVLLIAVLMLIAGCSANRYGCMKYHYKDVRMGLAH